MHEAFTVELVIGEELTRTHFSGQHQIVLLDLDMVEISKSTQEASTDHVTIELVIADGLT